MKAEDAARFADVWVTVTGNCNVIDEPAFKNMKDGAIVCNSGHFDSEINMKWLRAQRREGGGAEAARGGVHAARRAHHHRARRRGAL